MTVRIVPVIVLAILLGGYLPGFNAVAAAQVVPSSINYQGQLYDPSASGGAGGPLTGLLQVEFRIWDSGSGGTLLWARRFPVSANSQGLFNVQLNDGGTWVGGVVSNLSDAFQSSI